MKCNFRVIGNKEQGHHFWCIFQKKRCKFLGGTRHFKTEDCSIFRKSHDFKKELPDRLTAEDLAGMTGSVLMGLKEDHEHMKMRIETAERYIKRIKNREYTQVRRREPHNPFTGSKGA